MKVDLIFLSILNMGMTASVVILAVLLARGMMRRVPKKFAYALWLIVGIRLVCPVAVSSPLSVFNLPGMSHKEVRFEKNAAEITNQNEESVSGQKASQKNFGGESEAVQDGTAVLPEEKSESSRTTSDWIPDFGVVWIAGMLLFLLWNIFLTVRMKMRLRKAVRYRDNIYECENIPTPFVLGVFRPKIYIPFRLGEAEREYILKHEQFHIRRKDYLVKFAAMILTIVYWFHPLVWISYICMVRDMEMSCDEYVLGAMEQDIRINYSESLLGFAMNRRYLSMGLLSFGETSTRRRVKNIMKFQKQKKWIGIAAILLIIVVGAVCLTNARSDGQEPENNKNETVVKKDKEEKTKTAAPSDSAKNSVDDKEFYARICKLYSNKKIYTATMRSGEGAEILLVATNILSDNTAVSADVYQRIEKNGKDEFSFIGRIESTGSAYPLCKEGGYVLAGFHHASERLRVDNGVGTLQEIEGFGQGQKMCTLREYKMLGDKKTKLDEKKITEESAFSIDYYYDWDKDEMKGKPIVFKKFK